MWQSISYYAILGFEALVGIFGIRMYEEPPHTVLDRVGEHIEIREYPSRLAAQVELPTSGASERSRAFRILFSYISGANRAAAPSNNKIAMTAPVQVQEPQRMAMTAPVLDSSERDGVRMRFFLPARFTRETAPEPIDPLVRIVVVAEETVAVLRFSGSRDELHERESELVAGLAGSPWESVGKTYALFYDAPFTLPFLRRNEAVVGVTRREADR